MYMSRQAMRNRLRTSIEHLAYQGHQTEGMQARLASLPDSYDALYDFALALPRLPLRDDWPYVEPVAWDEIAGEMHPHRGKHIRDILPGETADRIRTAFLASVLGCMLGKPLEVNPTYDELRSAGLASGNWPLQDFADEAFLRALGRRHPCWPQCVRGHITHAVADDDIHYTILGMLTLETYGLSLTLDGVRRIWQRHQNINYTWGPERNIMVHIAASFADDHAAPPLDDGQYALWAEVLNPASESCGAAIRADAYGFACPGRPDIAVRLAYTDASLTHRRTGVYAAMFQAAALSMMPVSGDPLSAFAAALDFVPQRSRFRRAALHCLDIVDSSASFEQAYRLIHARYGEYVHCHVIQETGTLINTLKYAKDVWHGLCLQVMQGNDTDSYGARAGALLGMRMGPDALPQDRIRVFHDTILPDLMDFRETSLTRLADRMSALACLTAETAGKTEM